MRYQVKDFTAAGDVVLENGWVIGHDFGHMAYGYYLTSHKSQSMDAPIMVTGIGAEAKPAVSAEQFLVTISRAKNRALIYTDDADALRRNIQRSAQRASATELVRGELNRHGQPHRVIQALRDAAQRYRHWAAAQWTPPTPTQEPPAYAGYAFAP